jgi:hypothetical protein
MNDDTDCHISVFQWGNGAFLLNQGEVAKVRVLLDSFYEEPEALRSNQAIAN